MQPKNLESNIWKYAILLIANKRIFAAIISVYYLTIPDVTIQTIGLIYLAGNLAGFIFEILSGYISDKLGHKDTLVISRILMALSTCVFLFAENAAFLICGAILMSLSWAFMSGTGSAFMHETLRGLNRDHEYTKVMGKVSSIGFAIPIVFMVLTPFLVEFSYKAPFILALVTDIIGLIAAISLARPHVSAEEIKEIGVTNFRQVIAAGYKIGYFKYAILGAFTASVLTSAGLFRAPYQAELGIEVIWFGVLFGIGRALASLLLAYSGKIKDYFGDILTFYKYRIVLYTFLILLVSFTTNAWVVATAFILINGFQWGLSQIEKGYELEIIRDSKFKATLLSTESQIKGVLGGTLALVIGMTIEATAYQVTYFILALGFVSIMIPFYLYIKSKHQVST